MRVEEPPLDSTATPVSTGVVVHRTWQKHLVTFLMVFGPDLIVMEADNDNGAKRSPVSQDPARPSVSDDCDVALPRA